MCDNATIRGVTVTDQHELACLHDIAEQIECHWFVQVKGTLAVRATRAVTRTSNTACFKIGLLAIVEM